MKKVLIRLNVTIILLLTLLMSVSCYKNGLNSITSSSSLQSASASFESSKSSYVSSVSLISTSANSEASSSTISQIPDNKPIAVIGGDGLLIGGYLNKSIKDVNSIEPFITGKEKYSIIKGFEVIGTNILGSKIEKQEPGNGSIITLSTEIKFDAAISCDWNPLPRIPSIENNDKPSDKATIAGILKQNGIINNNPTIRQNFKIDLDNDGINEVLINASNIEYSSPQIKTKASNYSIIILQKVVNGKVTNIFLEKFIIPSDYIENENDWQIDYVSKILTVFDINNDNNLEILIGTRYYEGNSYAIHDSVPIKILENGWGA